MKPLINFFDIGQNKGDVTKMLIDIAESIECHYQIYAFEANEKWYEYCRKLFLNDHHVTCIHNAVSDKEENVKLYLAKNQVGHSIFKDKKNVDENKYEEIKAIKFSKWFSKNITNKFNTINVAKINIEGAEFMFFNDIIDSETYKHLDIICGSSNKDPQKIPSLEPELKEYYEKIEKHNIITHYFSDHKLQKNVDLKNMIVKKIKEITNEKNETKNSI